MKQTDKIIEQINAKMNICRWVRIILHLAGFICILCLIFTLYFNQPKFKYKHFQLDDWTIEEYKIQLGDSYWSIAEKYHADADIKEYLYNVETLNNKIELESGQYIAIYVSRDNTPNDIFTQMLTEDKNVMNEKILKNIEEISKLLSEAYNEKTDVKISNISYIEICNKLNTIVNILLENE